MACIPNWSSVAAFLKISWKQKICCFISYVSFSFIEAPCSLSNIDMATFHWHFIYHSMVVICNKSVSCVWHVVEVVFIFCSPQPWGSFHYVEVSPTGLCPSVCFTITNGWFTPIHRASVLKHPLTRGAQIWNQPSTESPSKFGMIKMRSLISGTFSQILVWCRSRESLEMGLVCTFVVGTHHNLLIFGTFLRP